MLKINLTEQELQSVNIVRSSLDTNKHKLPENRNEDVIESENLGSYTNNLNYSLRTLEFITFLENRLGSDLASNALSEENLAELLEIKKKIQKNIIESTNKYLRK